MRSSSFKSPKSYLYGYNLKNSKTALLRYVISLQITLILYHKLPKSPVFLQATVCHIQHLLYLSKGTNFLPRLYISRKTMCICVPDDSVILMMMKIKDNDTIDRKEKLRKNASRSEYSWLLASTMSDLLVT